MDYNVLKNSLNNVLHKLQLQERTVIKVRGAIVGKMGRKYLYKCLISDFSLDSPLCEGLWQRRLGVSIGPKYWKMVSTLKESKLRSMSWKLMHNIYPTRISLCKMGIVDTENCKYCNHIDTIEHFFFYCPKVKPLWRAIKYDILAHLNYNVNFSEKVIILGPLCIDNVRKKHLDKINQIIAVGRMVVSKFKYGPTRNILEIYESECILRKMWE